jgi:multiple sugar transport system ATP-binding protein
LKHFDLAVAGQEFLVLVGPSGSGKTTALRLLVGLEEISDSATSIGDRAANEVPAEDRDIAMVFQS